MSTSVQDAWTPEPELREPAPRRMRPSEYPDLTAPNVGVATAVGGALLVGGLGLLVYGLSGGAFFLILGIVMGIAGVAALIVPKSRAAQAKERAERLVREGQPIMARIVTTTNLTGNSEYGRIATYIVSLPGGDDPIRRDVSVDDRALPKSIPANVTALMDAGSGDVELYCALPFRAVTRTASVPDPLADHLRGASAPMPDVMADLPAAPPASRPGPASAARADVPDLPPVTPSASEGMSTIGGNTEEDVPLPTAPPKAPPAQKQTQTAPQPSKRPASGDKSAWD